MERLLSLLGLLVFLGIAWALSTDRKAIRLRTILWGLGLQFGLALFVLKVPVGQEVFSWVGARITRLLNLSFVGSEFVFGALGIQGGGKLPVGGDGTAGLAAVGFVFAFQILPTSIFVGQTEAPLTIRPFLNRMTRSELMCVMTAGMAHVSGSIMAAYIAFGVEGKHLLAAVIMTAPGTILLAKILVPETQRPDTAGNVTLERHAPDANVIGAAARGTTEGLHLALNVAAMLISFLSLVALANLLLGRLGDLVHLKLSLEAILGWAFMPLALVMGVPWKDAFAIGNLLGTR